MKNKLLTILLLTALSLNIPAYSFSLYKPDSKAEVKKLLNAHNKAMSEHKINEVMECYDKNYKSTDGFNLDDLAQMLQKTYSSYSNIKYKTKINHIDAYDNWAVVQMSDETSAIVHPDKKKTREKMGRLYGKSAYIVYLKKEKDEWKIISDDILAEETSLKYGIANKIDMDLVTPAFVKKGGEYDLSLKMQKPENIIAIASLTNEEIVYPPVDFKEKFRKFPKTGDLERLVKANDKNLDEYAVASIGFTKFSLNEEERKARIEILGMAYLMKRINMERINISVENN